MMQKKLLFITIFLTSILLVGCDKVEDTNVPQVKIYNLFIDLSNPEALPLKSIGECVALESIDRSFKNYGYNGIMVIQISPGVYVAYDQCCTNTPSEKHKIIPNGAKGICATCKSEFMLLDGLGTRISGPAPAKYNLRKYNIRLAGQKLIISN